MAKKKPKKIIIVGLLILILAAVGIFYYKDDTRLKSVKVDDPEKYAETKLKDDEECNNKISALNLSLDVSKSSETNAAPIEYELSCQPKANAIKNITGSEDVPVSFRVITSNLVASGSSGDFVCSKSGNSVRFTVSGNYKYAYLELIPLQSFQGSKKADGSYYTCMAKPEKGYGYVMLSIKENVGGEEAVDGWTPEGTINEPIDISAYNLDMPKNVEKDDENEQVDRIHNSTELSIDHVQVNRTLPKDTADYSAYNNKDKSYTFAKYLKAYNDLKQTNPEHTYSSVLGQNDNKPTTIKDGKGTTVKGIKLACKYNLNQADIQEMLKNNYNDTYTKENNGQLTTYYYDDYDDENPAKNTVFNTTYFYGSKTTVIGSEEGKYMWHLDVGSKGKATNIGQATCKRKCEEVVKVDYGPPVAVKAGMCFEYRVKVSSIVQCGIENEQTPEPVAPEVCLPTPTCWSNALKQVMKVAGPTEDFQACVEDCDGGKYTDKCSNKCYEKVYGEKDNQLKNDKYINPTFLGASLSTCTPGQYFRYGKNNSKINWCDFGYQPQEAGTNWRLPKSQVSSKSGREYLYARAAIYYGKTNFIWKTYSNSYQTTTRQSYRDGGSAGILRGYYNNDQCHDNCRWLNENAYEPHNSCSGKYLWFDYAYYNGLCGKLGSVANQCSKETKPSKDNNGNPIYPTYKDLTGVTKEPYASTQIPNATELRRVDTAYNKAKQIEVKKLCEAATTCNESQSTYIIKFNYTVKDNPEVQEVKPISQKLNAGSKENVKTKGNINQSGLSLEHGLV